MNALTLSIAIAAISFLGVILLIVLANKVAKRSAINKIKNTNRRLSDNIGSVKTFTFTK